MRGLILYRFVFLIILLSVLYIVQRFWFLRAWRLLGAVTEPGWRHLLNGLLVAVAAVVLATILEPMLGRFIPRQHRRVRGRFRTFVEGIAAGQYRQVAIHIVPGTSADC